MAGAENRPEPLSIAVDREAIDLVGISLERQMRFGVVVSLAFYRGLALEGAWEKTLASHIRGGRTYSLGLVWSRR